METPPRPPKPSTSSVGQLNKIQLDTLKEEIFNVVPDTVNTGRGTTSCLSQLANLLQGISHPHSFKDILADEEDIPLPIERP